jgi:small subunit ribosomal protein S20
MAAGAIPPPLFFERRTDRTTSLSATPPLRGRPFQPNSLKPSVDHAVEQPAPLKSDQATGHCRRIFETMANTTSAKKATRKIARRTAVNKSRRTQMRGALRVVEEAIKTGDRDAALKAMARAEPALMRAAQRNIIHKNNASRKVSRLSHQIAKLAK